MVNQKSMNKMIRFLISLKGKSNDWVKKKLAKMPCWSLLRFLDFVHNSCVYEQSSFDRFRFILMCCPRARLTKFLRSIENDDLIVLLERCDVLWTMFFVGLINLRLNSDVDTLLAQLMNQVYDPNFGVNLLLLLEREAMKQDCDLPREIRQKIFEFFCSNWNALGYIVKVKHGQEMTQDVNDFVSLMNLWMQEFSQNHGLVLNPSLNIEVRVFTGN
jgi:hypothetical protein